MIDRRRTRVAAARRVLFVPATDGRRAGGLLLLGALVCATAVALAASVAAAGAAGPEGGAARQNVARAGGDLSSISFVDAAHGWSVGPRGTISATSDAGSTWAAQRSGTSRKLSDVAFQGRRRGWAVGAAGTIVATTNGGASWHAQPSATTEALDAVSFRGAGRGWAVGAAGTILATSDGGATWSPRSSGTAATLHAVSFCDADHGWVAGADGTILATTDGGATWSPQASNTSESLNAIAFRDAGHGWAAGDGGIILDTTDGGATWRKQSSATKAVLRSLCFPSAGQGWAAGDGGVIVHTNNSGAKWKAQRSGTAKSLHCLSFYGSVYGWAAGNGGTIRATGNGGATWIVPPPKPALMRQPVAFGAKRRAETVVYNRLHYGQATWRLTPRVIVLHYTAGGTEASAHATFAADTPDRGVLPGVVAHFIIGQNGRIYQQLPPSVRGRHTVGLNHVAIGIEFVQDSGPDPAWSTTQIFHRKAQLRAGLRLVRWLAWRYHIKPGNIIGHGTANGSPFFKDRLHWRNTHVDWLAPAVRHFRALLAG